MTWLHIERQLECPVENFCINNVRGVINSSQGRLELRQYFIRRHNSTLKDIQSLECGRGFIISQITVWSRLCNDGEVLIEPVA